MARMRGERTDSYLVLVRKPEARMSCGRHRHRWKNNIKIELEEWYELEWTGLIWLIGREGRTL